MRIGDDRDRAAPVTEIARAKVNLTLHVTGRRADGYHLLDSLTVFPAAGDLIEVEPARDLSLSIAGPFGAGLAADGTNLVLRAAEALRPLAAPGPEGLRPGAAIRLVKALPVASGIGGGSADAAATLRALIRLWRIEADPARLARIALDLGADVPVCLASAPRRMEGVGEVLSAVPPLPPFHLLLVNPLVATPTPAVFAALRRRDNPSAPPVPAGLADARALADWLAQTRNDLTEAAIAVAPPVAQVLAALSAAPGCLLARMSGSGATCFGLFADAPAAAAAQAALPQAWWSLAAPVEPVAAAAP